MKGSTVMSRWLGPAALLLSAAVVFVACGDDEEGEGTTSEGTESTSGGEGAGGVDGAGGPDGWDGDPNPEGAAGGAAADHSTAAAGEENPWGDPETESGTPLPPRRPMSSAARGAYQRGISAAQAGDASAARAAFEEALSQDSSAYKAAYNLGVLLDRLGQESRALDAYQRALRIQPDYERAAAGVVAIHIRRGDVAEALAFIQPLARRWERNLYLQALYADVLVHADRGDDAVEAARAALRRDERFVPAMIAIVKASLKSRRTELAESVLDQALAIDDNNAEAHYLKGKMLLDQEGRRRDALGHLMRAVELRPDYLEARMAYGIQLLSGAQYDQALNHFQVAAQLAPRLVEVHLNLGDAYRATKQWEKAKQSFEKAMEMRSNLPEAHFNLGLMYLTAGESFPGLSLLDALQRSVTEFRRYREMMGPQLPRDDASQSYLEDLDRQIEREQKRIERDALRQQREAERAARSAAEPAEGAAAGGTQ